MEKALTFNQLAPYLPFGIRGVSKDENLGIELVKGYSTYGMNNNINLTTNIDDIDIECFMPILRPLSDLTNEIEHNGEKFIPMEYIMSMNSKSFKESLIKDRLTEALINDLKHNRLQYKYCEKLFEWHFDVFGLIPEGLAIDINTL